MEKNEIREQRIHNEKDNWRPLYHFTAPRGWINDPNGLIYFKGKYHLFYQFNPEACVWGSPCWGHAISDDMIHWEDMPVAIAPDQVYDKHPEGGCFSGSAVAHKGRLYIFYSATTKENGITFQTQCMASSEDGIVFEKYAENPLISQRPEHASEDFRDPKVFKAGDRWYMVVGGSIGGADNGGDGRVFLYESEDLVKWQYKNDILRSEGKLGTMFECPDMFELNGKWILTCSPMNHPQYNKSMYCVGNMDFEKGIYTIEKIGNLDFGYDYYAPQSFEDKYGNRIVIAWQNGWLWMPWCDNWGPTESENWRGALSIPRKVTLQDDLSLSLYPIEELDSICHDKKAETDVYIDKEKKYFYPQNPKSCYFKMHFDVNKVSSEYLEMGIMGDKNKKVLISLDLVGKVLTVYRGEADQYSGGAIHCPIRNMTNSLDVDIYIDRSSLEIYLEKGRSCVTVNIYPEESQKDIWLQTPYKSAIITSLEYGSMSEIWKS